MSERPARVTDGLLRAHRLVSTRWRVRRPIGQPTWFSQPADHERCDRECPCEPFDKLGDALVHAATRGETP